MQINQLVISLFMSKGALVVVVVTSQMKKRKNVTYVDSRSKKKDTDNEDEMTKMKPTDLDINKVMLFYYLRKDIPFTRKLANELFVQCITS